jgi:phenol/toluene 2-monooxygenase (NADH) P0/A0
VTTDTPNWGDALVRVTRVRREKFVEFEFAIGDEDVQVELVLPYPMFMEFCELREATMLPTADEALLDFAALADKFQLSASTQSHKESR